MSQDAKKVSTDLEVKYDKVADRNDLNEDERKRLLAPLGLCRDRNWKCPFRIRQLIRRDRYKAPFHIRPGRHIACFYMFRGLGFLFWASHSLLGAAAQPYFDQVENYQFRYKAD